MHESPGGHFLADGPAPRVAAALPLRPEGRSDMEVPVVPDELLSRARDLLVEVKRDHPSAEFFHRRLSIPLRTAVAVLHRLAADGTVRPGIARPAPAPKVAAAKSDRKALVAARAALPSATPLTASVTATPAVADAEATRTEASSDATSGSPAPAATGDITIASVQLDAIEVDPAAQVRARLCDEQLATYVAAIAGGAQFPPVLLRREAGRLVLVDGHHRLEAARQSGQRQIEARVACVDGREGLLLALEANGAHGKPLTRCERREAAMRLLADAEWRQWSDREIARRCGVSSMSVGRWRHESASPTPATARATAATTQGPSTAKRRCRTAGGGSREVSTARLGRPRRAAAKGECVAPAAPAAGPAPSRVTLPDAPAAAAAVEDFCDAVFAHLAALEAALARVLPQVRSDATVLERVVLRMSEILSSLTAIPSGDGSPDADLSAAVIPSGRLVAIAEASRAELGGSHDPF